MCWVTFGFLRLAFICQYPAPRGRCPPDTRAQAFELHNFRSERRLPGPPCHRRVSMRAFHTPGLLATKLRPDRFRLARNPALAACVGLPSGFFASPLYVSTRPHVAAVPQIPERRHSSCTISDRNAVFRGRLVIDAFQCEHFTPLGSSLRSYGLTGSGSRAIQPWLHVLGYLRVSSPRLYMSVPGPTWPLSPRYPSAGIRVAQFPIGTPSSGAALS